jgi:hypothetical protein
MPALEDHFQSTVAPLQNVAAVKRTMNASVFFMS